MYRPPNEIFGKTKQNTHTQTNSVKREEKKKKKLYKRAAVSFMKTNSLAGFM